MKKKITGNFGVDEYCFKLNSPFLAEKQLE